MTIPTSIKVGALTFRVDLVPSEDLGGDSGEFDNKTGRIRINKAMPQEQQELTFFHEILHAINAEMGEVEVEYLGSALYQVFTENKLLR